MILIELNQASEFKCSINITVVEAESTARLDVDFTIPGGQTVNASVANPSAANKVKVMLLADTFKEGEEKIVLSVTLPPDVGVRGVRF